jgi:hypothetical protein
MFGGVLEWRPRPTPGCSTIEEEEEEDTQQRLLKLLYYLRVSNAGMESCLQ